MLIRSLMKATILGAVFVMLMLWSVSESFSARISGAADQVVPTRPALPSPQEISSPLNIQKQEKFSAENLQSASPAAAEAPAQQETKAEAPAENLPPSAGTSAKHQVPPEPAKKLPADKYVTIDFDNVDIAVFVKFVSELTSKNFIIDNMVRGKVTIISPKKIPLRDLYKVFLSVLEVNGFTTVPVGDVIKIIPSLNAREKSVETRIQQEPADPEDRIVTQIIALERANPDDIKRVLDPMIAKSSSVLSYPPAGVLIITDFLSNIKRLQEIVAALDVEGAGDQVSYVPLQYAAAGEVAKSLTTIFQQRRPGSMPIRIVPDTRTNSIILLASVADAKNIRKLIALMDKDIPRGEANIQVYRLQNSNAEDLAKVLTNISKDTKTPGDQQRPAATVVAKNVQIVADKATNTLVIMAEREDYKILADIIKKLDVPRPMVYIEALIMEVNANKSFNIGVEWRGIKDTGSVSTADTGKSAAFVGSGGAGSSGGYNIIPGVPAAGSALAFPGGFSMGIIGAGITIGNVIFPNIGAVVQAYKNDSDVSILSTPQIMTLDNEEAEINVGKNVPYIIRQDSTATSAAYPINYNTYEYKDVGVKLTITPHINEDDYVRLKLVQTVSKVTEGAEVGRPTTLKREAKTTVVVKDKDTIVMGGLVGDSTEEGTYKVPLLGDIPLLGWLFKSKSSNREKTNLYIFITSHIVRTQQEAQKIFDQKRGSMGEVVEGIIKLDEKPADKQENSPPPAN